MNSLSPHTWQSYRSALNIYLSFCCLHSITPPFPLSELSLARFATHLAHSSRSYGTIRVYLSGLRFMQLARGLPDPSLNNWTFLDQVLRGIRRELPSHVRSPRLPITPYILGVLLSVWSRPPVTRHPHVVGGMLHWIFRVLPFRRVHVPFYGSLHRGYAIPSRRGYRFSLQPLYCFDSSSTV